MQAIHTSPANALSAIQLWEHWHDIQLGAEKEYGMSAEEFDRLLPEYQKFMGLIALGEHGLGMFSSEVDKIWHSMILNTMLYEQFCMQIFGRFIHHAPNLSKSHAECSTICSGIPCDSVCKTEDPIPVPPPPKPDDMVPMKNEALQFYQAYASVFGPPPQCIWNLPEMDGIAM
jgi:hypothetical protein